MLTPALHRVDSIGYAVAGKHGLKPSCSGLMRRASPGLPAEMVQARNDKIIRWWVSSLQRAVDEPPELATIVDHC